MSCVHSIPREIPKEGYNQQISESAHPAALDSIPEIQAIISSTKSASASSFHHQTAAPNQHQLPASTTRQQHQISISFQLPPPDSSTKSASASTTRQQYHISQPPARHPANQLLTLPPCHTHIMAAKSVVV